MSLMRELFRPVELVSVGGDSADSAVWKGVKGLHRERQDCGSSSKKLYIHFSASFHSCTFSTASS